MSCQHPIITKIAVLLATYQPQPWWSTQQQSDYHLLTTAAAVAIAVITTTIMTGDNESNLVRLLSLLLLNNKTSSSDVSICKENRTKGAWLEWVSHTHNTHTHTHSHTHTHTHTNTHTHSHINCVCIKLHLCQTVCQHFSTNSTFLLRHSAPWNHFYRHPLAWRYQGFSLIKIKGSEKRKKRGSRNMEFLETWSFIEFLPALHLIPASTLGQLWRHRTTRARGHSAATPYSAAASCWVLPNDWRVCWHFLCTPSRVKNGN